MRLRRLLSSAIFPLALVAAATAAPARPVAKARRQIPQVRPADPCGMAELSQQILLKPSDVNAHVMRAACLLMSPSPTRKPPLSNIIEAVGDLEIALKLDPQNYYAHLHYGQAAYLLGYDDLAIADFTKAIALNDRGARSYLERGWAHSHLCQINDAEADFAQAVRIDSSLQNEVASPSAMARQRVLCLRPRPAAPTRACPTANIAAFSLSARIVLENEWRKQHPGCSP